MESQTLIWIVGAAVALGAGLYLYLDQQARTLRTRVVDTPDGLRFDAHQFSVEVQRTPKLLKVHTIAGRLTQTPLAGGEAKVQTGPVEAVLPAAGLKIEVARVSLKSAGQAEAQPTGLCTVALSASDALNNAALKLPGGYATAMKMEQVPEEVAVNFQDFASRVRVWVEKIEKRLELDRIAGLRKEQEAVQAAEDEKLLAEALAAKGSDKPLTEGDREALAGVQIAKWRKTAGFSGSASEVSIDPQGRVAWFVDLADDGRITLHSNKRTIHTTLRGADIVSLGGELEIGVRDDFWSEEEPALRVFRILLGVPPDERRAWKERLELLRDSLRASSGRSG